VWPRWGTKQDPLHPVQVKTSCPPSCCGSRTSGEISLVPPSLPLFLCLSVLLPVCLYFDCHRIIHALTVCLRKLTDVIDALLPFPLPFSTHLELCVRTALHCTKSYHTVLHRTPLLYYTALHCRHIMELKSI
jgi:hypothetical protein